MSWHIRRFSDFSSAIWPPDCRSKK